MIEVAMELDSLPKIAACFEAPYSIRPFRPGDDVTWFDIQDRTRIYSPIDPGLFAKQFGSVDLSRRQFFVLHEGEPVGTGTAWIGEPVRTNAWGRVHWVAIVPEHQRRGLGRELMHSLFGTFRALRCSRAFLTTGSENDPAIRLYDSLGFRPWIRSEEERAYWESRVTRGVA
jgi:ribosomal protein S18 acetylase RimI-like enzyme